MAVSSCPVPCKLLEQCPLSPKFFLGLFVFNLYYVYLAWLTDTTFLSGLSSLLFWVTMLHCLGALHGKLVASEQKEDAKQNCKVSCAFTFEFSEDQSKQMKEDLEKLVNWLKKILYCESMAETGVILAILFLLGNFSNYFSNRYSLWVFSNMVIGLAGCGRLTLGTLLKYLQVAYDIGEGFASLIPSYHDQKDGAVDTNVNNIVDLVVMTSQDFLEKAKAKKLQKEAKLDCEPLQKK